jgi:hypothetical protein
MDTSNLGGTYSCRAEGIRRQIIQFGARITKKETMRPCRRKLSTLRDDWIIIHMIRLLRAIRGYASSP